MKYCIRSKSISIAFSTVNALLLVFVLASCGRKAEFEMMNSQADSLKTLFLNSLSQANHDEGQSRLNQLLNLTTSYGSKPFATLWAETLNTDYKKFLSWKKSAGFQKELIRMTDEEYEKLIQGNFLKTFSNYKAINRCYLNELKSMSSKRNEYVLAEKKRIAEEEKERKKRERFLKRLIGTKYAYPKSMKLIESYGSPQTLKGTNSMQWIAYFPKGNFTLLINKSSNKVIYSKNGKVNNLRKPINIFSETRKLYRELMTFKGKSDFHTYGFSSGYKYHNWLIKVKNLKNQPEAKELLKKDIVVGDLEMLGLEYVRTKGRENDYTRFTNNNFKKALY